MELTKEQRIMQAIITKSWEDEAFKKMLLSKPVSAIEKVTGEKICLPEGKTLVVCDQTDDQSIYINIPAERKFEDVELNDEQLEVVAGGTDKPQNQQMNELLESLKNISWR